MSKHFLKTDFCFDGSNDVPIEVEFNYYKGTSTAPPSYYHGGLPPDPPLVDIISIKVKGKPATERQMLKAQASEWLQDRLFEEVDKCL